MAHPASVREYPTRRSASHYSPLSAMPRSSSAFSVPDSMVLVMPAIHSIRRGTPFVQKFCASDRMRMSFVDLWDCAEAAAEIVASGAYTCGTCEFCSEGTYSRADMESILSELAGCRWPAS